MEHELYHYGILGMKWGIRRYQNEDGSWTSAGKKRYGDSTADKNNTAKYRRAVDAAHVSAKLKKLDKKERKKGQLKASDQLKREKLTRVRDGLVKDLNEKELKYGEEQFKYRKMMMKTAAISTALIGVSPLIMVGAYALSSHRKEAKEIKAELELEQMRKTGK